MKDLFDISIIWKKVNSKLAEKEEKELQDWIGDNRERKDYSNKVYSYFESGSKIKTKDINVEKAKRKVAFSVFVRPKIQNAFKVAAIFIGIVATAFFLQQTNKNNPTAESTVQIEPGKAKANIILSDGSRHYLDEENLQELKEKGTVILSSGNQLNYKTESLSDELNLTRLKSRYNTINIPRGGEFFVQLSDGTKVWLNSETTLTYPLQFGNKERKVELIGEACFEVKHDPERPFKVELAGQVIEVLGTTFNVNAYADESKTSTTLLEGSVKIYLDGGQEDVLLKPGTQCELNKTDQSYLVSEVDVRKVIAWRDGNYLFDNATVEEMMVTLSRWYDFTFNFENQNARQVRFNGKLKRTDKFEDILTIIEKTYEVKFKVKERNVIIY